MAKRTVVFVPGVLGTALKRGAAAVWPPSGPSDPDALRDPELKTDDVIRGVVGGRDGYAPLFAALNTMGFEEDGDGDDALLVWPYDWRRDLRKSAERLAAFLDARTADRDEVLLLAHGGGGLICRNMLESGRHARSKGVAKTTALITLATPHLGAPIALWRLLGRQGVASLPPRTFTQLADDSRYPAFYQLAPAPQARALWDARDQLKPLNLYDPLVFPELRHGDRKLDADQVALARAFWAETSFARRPKPVRYFAIAGGALGTITHLLRDGPTITAVRAENAGDGVMPIWSAGPVPAVQTLIAGGEHGALFDDRDVIVALTRLLDAPAAKADDAPRALSPSGPPAARLLLANRAPTCGDMLDIALRFPKPIPAMTALLRVKTTDETGRSVASWPMRYSGPPTAQISTAIAAPNAPGVYSLELEQGPFAATAERFMAIARTAAAPEPENAKEE